MELINGRRSGHRVRTAGALTINTGASTITNSGVIKFAEGAGGLTITSAINNGGGLVAIPRP